MSKRRLFFTDRQLLFICNEGTCTESDDWEENEIARGMIQNMFPHVNTVDKHNGMVQAMAHISEYSGRELSYDSDALKAISGALAVLPPAMG